jgi:hypothetical protein
LYGYVSIRNTKISTMALQSDCKIALLGMVRADGGVRSFAGKFSFELFPHDKITAAVFAMMTSGSRPAVEGNG